MISAISVECKITLKIDDCNVDISLQQAAALYSQLGAILAPTNQFGVVNPYCAPWQVPGFDLSIGPTSNG